MDRNEHGPRPPLQCDKAIIIDVFGSFNVKNNYSRLRLGYLSRLSFSAMATAFIRRSTSSFLNMLRT